jgi:uncharacterized protein (DUF58 family)
MSPTPGAAAILAGVAVLALLVSPAIALLAAVAVVTGIVVDALQARAAPQLDVSFPRFLARGVASRFAVALAEEPAGGVRLRQASAPDVELDPQETRETRLEGTIVVRRRGRHVLPPPAVRAEGPLGLGAWYHRGAAETELVVYPDVVEAFRLALAVRRGTFRESGRRMRGPLGLGTDFESIRDYLPDDDLRQVNWPATERLGRPMSNQYRIEQDRDVICLVDTGRLMAAPLGALTRLDAALDAAVAVAAVADEVGDRCGLVAFDREVRRRVDPRRRGSNALIRAVFDLEPESVDSDFALAFTAVGGAKRSLVLVFTDLLEESAARPLLDAMPLLTARHHVVVASAVDPDLEELAGRAPVSRADVYEAAAAHTVLEARRQVAASMRHAGADVVEAHAAALPAACVGAYLRAKARARL